MSVDLEGVVACREPWNHDAGVTLAALIADESASLFVTNDDVDCTEQEVRIELDVDARLAVLFLERQGVSVDDLLEILLPSCLMPGHVLDIDDFDSMGLV